MEEDNDSALKRQYNNDQKQDSQDDPLTTSPKRFKLNTDTTEDLVQEPLDTSNNDGSNGDTNKGVAHTQNGDLTLSITNGQASVAPRNQQDNADGSQHTMQTPPPATSSSPFALHPILDELTNKPIYPSHESPGMRMSMSAILTETGKGYHDRPSSQNNAEATTTTASSSSLSPSSNLPNSSMPQPSTSRDQSLPPVNHFPHHHHHHHHHPSTSSETYHRQTASPPTESSSLQQQQHHHRTSSHPTIASMMTQLNSDEPVKDNKAASPDNQQHRQSITNEQLVRALTTSIPMANDQSTQPQATGPISHPQPILAKTDVPTSSSSLSTLLSAAPETQPEVKQEESTTTVTATATTTADAHDSSTFPSQPDLGAALRRLSGTTGPDQHQHPSSKKEDVSPSEILGSALAAVARSQQHGASTTAAAAAIGNLAAITANISHILNNNHNDSNNTNSTSSPAPQSSSSSTQPVTPSVPGITTVTPPLTIPAPLEQQDRHKDGNEGGTVLEDRQRNTTQALPPSTLSTMLDQAIQLGRTQQHQLQQDESTGTTGNNTVNQETAEGMKRTAEAAAEVAAAVANASTTSTTGSPSASASIRLHNHHQPSPSHYNTATSSLLPTNQQPPHRHPPPPPPHHYQHHQHPYQAPLHYGQMMYSSSTAVPGASSLHAASPPIYPPHPPPSVVQPPKVVINNEQVWKAMKDMKETNLGFYLYQPSMLLPNLQEHLNGIVQVRIPARYLTYQNPKVKKRAIWGTGIYTDDSDVVSMAIHSGKFIPAHHDPELESNDPFLLAVAGKTMDSIRAATKKQAMSPKTYLLGRHGDDTLPDYDIKVTLRVLPKLQDYTSTIQHRIKSRPWGRNHDGVSFFVEKVEQLKKGEARPCGRSSLKSNLFRYESYRKQAPRLMTGAESDKSPNPIDHVV